MIKMQLAQLKKDEASLQEQRKTLEKEKNMHIRELRRIQNEDRSIFNKHPILHGRYFLMSILGRGGFSEVWKAFDMKELCEVGADRSIEEGVGGID